MLPLKAKTFILVRKYANYLDFHNWLINRQIRDAALGEQIKTLIFLVVFHYKSLPFAVQKLMYRNAKHKLMHDKR